MTAVAEVGAHSTVDLTLSVHIPLCKVKYSLPISHGYLDFVVAIINTTSYP